MATIISRQCNHCQQKKLDDGTRMFWECKWYCSRNCAHEAGEEEAAISTKRARLTEHRHIGSLTSAQLRDVLLKSPRESSAFMDSQAERSSQAAEVDALISEKLRKDLEECYFPKFLPADLCNRTEEFLRSVQPEIIKFGQFKIDLTSRPKFVWGIPNTDGEFPLYVFGQAKVAYSLMEPMTPILHEVANFLETRFDHPKGFLNIAMATYYWNGTDQHIPPHQDKTVSKESTGKDTAGKQVVENFASIYNISWGAVRPFQFLSLEGFDAFNKDKATDLKPYILKSIPMHPADMVRLSPSLNEHTAHMVPKDVNITELRISLVFRHCDKRWVKPNEYHYDMVLKGRMHSKEWQKGAQKNLPGVEKGASP